MVVPGFEIGSSSDTISIRPMLAPHFLTPNVVNVDIRLEITFKREIKALSA